MFALLVVPGFLFVRGFFRGRSRADHEQTLYVLAEAVVASLLILAVTFPVGGDSVLARLDAGVPLSDHPTQTYWFLVALLLVPFPTGIVVGGALDALIAALSRRRSRLTATGEAQRSWRGRLEAWLLRALEARELLRGASTWDRVWSDVNATEDYVWVRVKTKSGSDVTGRVGKRSRVALSPQPRDLFIEQVYRARDPTAAYSDMLPVDGSRGIFVSGTDIESVEFRGHEASVAPRDPT